MENYFDILMKRAEIVRNWKEYTAKVVEAVKKILPDAHVYMFGSVIKGEATGGSDIDILIVSKKIPKSNIERSEIKIKIEELSNLPFYHPFEFHLADEEEAKWYFNRVKELKEISN